VNATIALEDGAFFRGRAFAGQGEAGGELVFNTSMTGYQEILTDPSYHGQLVTLTYPLIGNYGVNVEDEESDRVCAGALVVGECSRITSNWRASEDLPSYLRRHRVLGIDQVDTRALTLRIRRRGAMKCCISTEEMDVDTLVDKARALPDLVGRNLVAEVSTPAAYDWPQAHAEVPPHARVAVLDCGIKRNQLRLFAEHGLACRVFPHAATAAEILAWRPDGLFISNGPGDPAAVLDVIATVRTLIGTGLPTFGICLGHQLIALAMGCTTYKLKFGHRGANHPILNRRTDKVEIASHNHGFCVDADSVEASGMGVSHVNLNDQTVAGLRHRSLPLFCVQYHPEAAPGPHDPHYLFADFIQMIADSGGKA